VRDGRTRRVAGSVASRNPGPSVLRHQLNVLSALQGTRRARDVNEIKPVYGTMCRAGRSGDQDNPMPVHCRMRALVRDPIRGGHYGQRSCEPHLQAEHMAAPTSGATWRILLANPELSTHGVEEVCVDSTRRLESTAHAHLANPRRTAPPVRPSLSFRQRNHATPFYVAGAVVPVAVPADSLGFNIRSRYELLNWPARSVRNGDTRRNDRPCTTPCRRTGMVRTRSPR